MGLGGRYDATNIQKGHIAVLCGVAFDHQDFLGDSLESIAFEKAGIFSEGQHVIVGLSGLSEGISLLKEKAISAGATSVEIVDMSILPSEWTLGMGGAYQRGNCAAAVTAAATAAGGASNASQARLCTFFLF